MFGYWNIRDWRYHFCYQKWTWSKQVWHGDHNIIFVKDTFRFAQQKCNAFILWDHFDDKNILTVHTLIRQTSRPWPIQGRKTSLKPNEFCKNHHQWESSISHLLVFSSLVLENVVVLAYDAWAKNFVWLKPKFFCAHYEGASGSLFPQRANPGSSNASDTNKKIVLIHYGRYQHHKQ